MGNKPAPAQDLARISLQTLKFGVFSSDERRVGQPMGTPVWKPLGALLVEQAWLTAEELERALEEQERSGRKLGQIVVEAGFISIEELTTVLLEQCGIDISTQDGFGSGLRDQLARRRVDGRRDREPVRFEFTAEPEPVKEARVRRSRRLPRIIRNPNRKPLKRLERLVKDFERQERELAETITSLRRTLTPGA